MTFISDLKISPSGTWKIVVIPEDKEAKDLIATLDPKRICIEKLGTWLEISVLH